MSDRSDYEIQTNTQKISGINEEKEAAKLGRPFSFYCATDVKVGDYFNCAKSYLDFGTAGTGEVAGMASAHNAEIKLPNKTVTSGVYAALETNYNFQASTVLQDTSATPQCIATFKVGGHQTGIDAWEAQTNTGVFAFSGLTAADDEVYDLSGGNAVFAAGLRIMINDTVYWIMLTTDCSP